MPLVLTCSFRLSIKEGAKPTMFLLSMVQSAFPDWVHRSVELSPETFVAKTCRVHRCSPSNPPMLLVSTLLSPSSLRGSTFTCTRKINPLLLLFEEELFWLVFLLCLLNSEVSIGSCFPLFWTIKEHNGMCFKMTVHMNVTVRPFLLSNHYN